MVFQRHQDIGGKRADAAFLGIRQPSRIKAGHGVMWVFLLLFFSLNFCVFAMGRASKDQKAQVEAQAQAKPERKGEPATMVPEPDARPKAAPPESLAESRPPARSGADDSSERPRRGRAERSPRAQAEVTSPALSAAPATSTLSAAVTTSTLPAAPASSDVSSTVSSATAATTDTAQPVASEPDKMDKLIQLNLKNANIDQIIKFLTDETGKPVIKPQNVNTNITVAAPEKIPVIQALDLVYDALLLQGFVVLESEDRIQIVAFDSLKEGDIITVSGPLPPELRRQKSRLIRRVISMTFVEADTLVPKFQPLLGKFASILTDRHTNKMIITDTVGNIERYEQILAELDVSGFEEIEMRIIELKNASVSDISSIVRESLSGLAPRREGGRSPRDTMASATPIPRTNSVLLIATKDVFQSVLNLIEELDKEKEMLTISGPIPESLRADKNRLIRRVISLQYVDAENIVSRLQPVVGRYASIITDRHTNKIIITDTVGNIERYEEILAELDAPGFDQIEMKIIELHYADANEVATAIRSYVREGLGVSSFRSSSGRSSGSQTVYAVALTRNNSILLIVSRDLFPTVLDLIQELDRSQEVITVVGPLSEELRADKNRLVRRVFVLEYSDPAVVREAFVSMLGSGASILADSNSGKLIITDRIKNIERCEDILKEIDVPGYRHIESKVIRLLHAEADEVQGVVQGLIREKIQAFYRRPGGRSGTDFRRTDDTAAVFSFPRTNSILITAPKEYLLFLEQVVKELDTERPRDREMYILDLKYADTENLARSISQLFPPRRGVSERERVEIIPSGRKNALIVVASEENFKHVQELVAKLDTEEAQKRETRRYVLKYLDASDTAKELGDLYSQMKEQYNPWDWWSPYRRGQSAQEEVNFVAVVRSNAVLVIAPPSEFELIESLIYELDVPIEKEEVLPKIYRIRNADATEVEKLLNTIFGNQPIDARRNAFDFWRRGTADQQALVGRLSGKVRFSSDINTNSIVAIANNNTLYEIVDDVIADIDKAMPELANTLIIPLEHSNAGVMAAELNSLFGRPVQAQQQRGQGEETPSAAEFIFNAWWGNVQRAQPGERPISNLIDQVRFVPDPRTNSLLVTTASHNFPVIKDLVEQLDKEEPQALVKVRIVEIRKDNVKKVGLRWTPAANLYSMEDLDNAFRVMSSLQLIDTFTFGGEGNGIITSNVNMDLVMQLLLRNLDAEVRVDPTLYMSNNTKGSIFAGDNVPRLTRTETTPQGGTNSIFANEDVGVTMEITPHINQRGTVVMTVSLRTSRITGEQRYGSDILQSRQYNTEIAVQSGETMVLGGIRLNNKQRIVRKIPILGQIPYLGVLFRNYDTIDATSDIFVFITPTVVFSEREARDITTEYQKVIGDTVPSDNASPSAH